MDRKEQKIDEILGRALRDSEFRAKLTSDPAAAGAELGLSLEEVEMIAGGLAIGDSLLNPQTVAWCTGKICNETGRRVRRDIYINPAEKYKPVIKPTVKPGVTRQEKKETEKV